MKYQHNEFSKSLYLLFTLLVIFSGFIFPSMFLFYNDHSAALWHDEVLAINQINFFISHPFTIINYPAIGPMLPGCHLFMAYVAKLLGKEMVYLDTWSIKIIHSFFGYGILILAWSLVWSTCRNSFYTFCLITPIASSFYILASAIWPSTDNGAIFFYLLIMLLLNMKLENRIASFLIISAAFLMVFWRQLYLPVIGVFWATAFFSNNRINALKLATATTIPVAILMGIYFLAWGGHLTPPTTMLRQSHQISFFHIVNILHFLALLGLLGLPYLLLFYFDKELQFSKRKWANIFAISFVFAMLLWMNSPSTYLANADEPAGGLYGSIIWSISKSFPYFSLGQRSFLVLVLSFIGACMLYIMIIRACYLRYYPIELVMLICYSIGYTCQSHPWQRYLEGLILITFAMYGARLKPEFPKVSFSGPLLYFFYPVITLVICKWNLIISSF